jgi:hypothetical protein
MWKGWRALVTVALVLFAFAGGVVALSRDSRQIAYLACLPFALWMISGVFRAKGIGR